MISEGITYYIYNYTDKCALRYLLVLPILDYLVPSTALPLYLPRNSSMPGTQINYKYILIKEIINNK